MNLTSRNRDPIHASLALSSLLSVWYKPNSLNNKSMYNTLLLKVCICAKPRLTNWYSCPKKRCHYFCTGVYTVFVMLHKHLTCLTLFTNIMLIICYFVVIRNRKRGITSPPPWRRKVGNVMQIFSDILWEQSVQYVLAACIKYVLICHAMSIRYMLVFSCLNTYIMICQMFSIHVVWFHVYMKYMPSIVGEQISCTCNIFLRT